MISNSKTTIKNICELIINNARAREIATKARKEKVAPKNKWEMFMNSKYRPSVKPGELYLVEGDSALGSILNARYPEFQSAFALKGNAGNVFDRFEGAGILDNAEFKEIIRICSAGWGPTFDLDKFKFERIVIATDADIDGYGIRSLLIGFLAQAFPGLIDNGQVFIAEPPLYVIQQGNKEALIAHKQEYYEYIYNTAKKNGINLNVANCNNYALFVQNLFQHYYSALISASLGSANIKLIASVVDWAAESKLNIDEISDKLKDVKYSGSLVKYINVDFPDITYDKEVHSLTGIIGNKHQLLYLSHSFFEIIKSAITFCMKYNDIKIGVDKISAYDLYLKLKDCEPRILRRYKGLGTAAPKELQQTIMNPDTRRLIKVNCNDRVKLLTELRDLRGKSNENMIARKQMMLDFYENVLTKDMIDT